MKSANLDSPLPEKASFPQVVVLHGERPQQALTKVRQNLLQIADQDLTLCIKSWAFHELERLDLRAMTRHLAAKAWILVLATDRRDDPPDHIKEWIHQSFSSALAPKPIVIGLHANSLECTHYLQTLARSWDSPFFACSTLASQAGKRQIRELMRERWDAALVTGEQDTVKPRPRTHPTSPSNEQPVTTQEIRDLAYTLWLAADRPSGGISGFLMLAAARLQAARESFNTAMHPFPNHENHTHSTGSNSRLHPEFMLGFQTRLHAGARPPLLQHLAQTP